MSERLGLFICGGGPVELLLARAVHKALEERDGMSYHWLIAEQFKGTAVEQIPLIPPSPRRTLHFKPVTDQNWLFHGSDWADQDFSTEFPRFEKYANATLSRIMVPVHRLNYLSYKAGFAHCVRPLGVEHVEGEQLVDGGSEWSGGRVGVSPPYSQSPFDAPQLMRVAWPPGTVTLGDFQTPLVPGTVDWRGRTLVPALLDCRIVVTGYGFVGHLAAALGRRTLMVHNATDPAHHGVHVWHQGADDWKMSPTQQYEGVGAASHVEAWVRVNAPLATSWWVDRKPEETIQAIRNTFDMFRRKGG